MLRNNEVVRTICLNLPTLSVKAITLGLSNYPSKLSDIDFHKFPPFIFLRKTFFALSIKQLSKCGFVKLT